MTDPLRAVMDSIGYEFRDTAPLVAALTHRSYASEAGSLRASTDPYGPDNERLEFLGDAVLSMLVAEALWTRAAAAREGALSRMRAAIVNEASLADAAAKAGLGDALRLGRGEQRSGGRTRPSMLADAFEALLAGVFLDGGIDAARGVVLRTLGARIDDVAATGAQDDKSLLQEILQARHRITPRYEVVAVYGPDHEREHEVELRAGNVVSARGRGRSKKDAEQAAARAALAALEQVATTSPATTTDAGTDAAHVETTKRPSDPPHDDEDS
jgi:ribonuclease-3